MTRAIIRLTRANSKRIWWEVGPPLGRATKLMDFNNLFDAKVKAKADWVRVLSRTGRHFQSDGRKPDFSN